MRNEERLSMMLKEEMAAVAEQSRAGLAERDIELVNLPFDFLKTLFYLQLFSFS